MNSKNMNPIDSNQSKINFSFLQFIWILLIFNQIFDFALLFILLHFQVPKPYVVHVPKAVPVPKPYPVHVPVRVPKPVIVPVYKAVPVPVAKPVHKIVPIIKEKPYYVKKKIPIL